MRLRNWQDEVREERLKSVDEERLRVGDEERLRCEYRPGVGHVKMVRYWVPGNGRLEVDHVKMVKHSGEEMMRY